VAAESEAAREQEAVESVLREAGHDAAALEDPAALVASLERELAELEQARAERRTLEARREEAAREAQRLESERAVAASRVETAVKRGAGLDAERGVARKRLDVQLEKLRERARGAGWEGLERSEGDRDEAAILDWRRKQTEAERSDAAGHAGRLGGDVERLEKAVERAAALRARREQLEDEATLNRTLAQHLQANQFLAFVQEEALRVLADDGSRHLEALSQGRYSLETRAQDFEVVDHWNADRQRSVKTLSGGESFLASLALALALAERLAELSARGRAGETLESLFLDEGFGSLDPEALDLVLQAIEALHGGERIVGVVTHIQPLAERLPARIEVRREPGGTARLDRA
jgi:exonuclease SbcC